MTLILWILGYFGFIALFTFGFSYLDQKYTKDITKEFTPESVRRFFKNLP